MGNPMTNHEYNPSDPMADSGDLLTDLANNVKNGVSLGGVETGQVSAVNDPYAGRQREPGD